MYCDTKAEWMVTALGCFKFNYTMVTIYTNLGEDGVTYGIHQTQSNYVCTSQELLPKLIKVLDKVRIFYNNNYAGTLRTKMFDPFADFSTVPSRFKKDFWSGQKVS